MTISDVRGGVWIKVKLMWPPSEPLGGQVSVRKCRMIRALNKQIRS